MYIDKENDFNTLIENYIKIAISRVIDHNNKISKVIEYIKKFEGAPYKLYTLPYGPTKDCSPFWIENKKPPNFEYVYEKGLVCTGLVNLARRYVELDVPGHISNKKTDSFIGGTSSWFSYLTQLNRLEKINFYKSYPKGTILLQDYNDKDQGHVSVTINSETKGLLHSKIIHAIGGSYNEKYYNSTVIEILNEFPDYKRFTHICRPQYWLLQN